MPRCATIQGQMRTRAGVVARRGLTLALRRLLAFGCVLTLTAVVALTSAVSTNARATTPPKGDKASDKASAKAGDKAGANGSRMRLVALHVDAQESDILGPLATWATEARLRTSLELEREAARIDVTSDAIFSAPLLVWGPAANAGRIPEADVDRLREHLGNGGLLWIDDTSASGPSSEVDSAVRSLVQRLFGRPLETVPVTDVVYRSFYRLTVPVGRRADLRVLEGLRIGKRWAILYGRDDLLGALRRSPTGGPASPAVPGGEAQREQAFRLAVNLLVYATCLDYKDDHVHVEALLRSRRGRGARGPTRVR